MSTQPHSYLTPEQYLEIERKAEFKSEYIKGEMFAMAGATLAHNRIVTALMGELRQQLRGGTCEVLGSDMRVAASAADVYAYPDACVCCGGPIMDGGRDTLLNPILIVEVLSSSTKAYDCTEKFKYYRTIESFREYLLVASESIDVELRQLRPDGEWILRYAERLEDVIELQSIGCRLSLADLYEKVEFGERAPYSRPLHR